MIRNWLRRLFKGGPKARNEEQTAESATQEANSVKGDHPTSDVEEVKQLKREGRHPEAIDLLRSLIQASEQEEKARQERGFQSQGVAAWYYEQLAIIYRKEARYDDEVAILERYQSQPQAPSALQEKLTKRLKRARELANNEKAAADSPKESVEHKERS